MEIRTWGKDRFYIARNCRATKANHYSNTEWFHGYNEMGGAMWGELKLDQPMEKEEALATLADLKAADEY